jgi:hypothetical protein
MAKAQMVCPFSKKQCIECAQFRGRHYYMCCSLEFLDHCEHWQYKARSKTGLATRNYDVEKPPALPENPKWLTNVEELVERSEG